MICIGLVNWIDDFESVLQPACFWMYMYIIIILIFVFAFRNCDRDVGDGIHSKKTNLLKAYVEFIYLVANAV